MSAPTAPVFHTLSVHAGLDLEDYEIEALSAGYARALETLGGTRRTAAAVADGSRPVAIFMATGGTERTVLELWKRRRKAVPDEPLLLVAHPGNNSLPAALEVLARLQQDGMAGRIVYLSNPDDADGLREIAEAVQGTTVRRALAATRIGLVGEPSDWLVASTPDPATVQAMWGPTVVPIEMEEVVKAMESIADSEVEPLVAELLGNASEVREPTSSDVRDVGKVYSALRRLVNRHQLHALTVRCFDLVLQQRTTGCFALAQLTDEGLIAGCEGDLVSTVGMLWARELTGATPWMANPAQIDCSHNTLWLAHCTVPRSLVSSYRLRSHFESGLGVGIAGTLPVGPVTMLRIGGRAMDRVWLAEGELLRNGEADNLCRTQVEIRLTGGGTVSDLLSTPLGNHVVLVLGHHLERLERWCGAFISNPPIRRRE